MPIPWTTYNDRNASLVRNLTNLFKVRHVVSGVANALKVHSLCLFINGFPEIFRLVSVDEFGVDAQSREEDFELVVGAAV